MEGMEVIVAEQVCFEKAFINKPKSLAFAFDFNNPLHSAKELTKILLPG
jgi:hypothetical protein